MERRGQFRGDPIPGQQEGREIRRGVARQPAWKFREEISSPVDQSHWRHSARFWRGGGVGSKTADTHFRREPDRNSAGINPRKRRSSVAAGAGGGSRRTGRRPEPHGSGNQVWGGAGTE